MHINPAFLNSIQIDDDDFKLWIKKRFNFLKNKYSQKKINILFNRKIEEKNEKNRSSVKYKLWNITKFFVLKTSSFSNI